VIRIAAVGDIHLGIGDAGSLRPSLEDVASTADLLLLAGDLTRRGTAEEGRVVADELNGLNVPVIAVLGNHDYHSDQSEAVMEALAAADVEVLEGTSIELEVGSTRIGIGGTKGCGGGFGAGLCADFGDPETKQIAASAVHAAERLTAALSSLGNCDVRVALTHYSPVVETLAGEPAEIFPFLGNSLMAHAIDGAGVHLALHGHAHKGGFHGATAGGVPVRNVAQQVIDRPYAVLELDDDGLLLTQQLVSPAPSAATRLGEGSRR
jgi:Icc-related predicted phosphoesterase